MSQALSWTVLAHLLRPQGRRGEVLADLLTDFPDRLARRARLFLAPPGFSGSIEEARNVDVLESWLPKGKNEGRIVLHIGGCSDIEQASGLTGLDLITPSEDRISLSEDESYISDLIGCAVLDGQLRIGIVTDVQFPTSADGRTRLDAAPWLLVRGEEGAEMLVPFVRDFLVAIEIAKHRILMRLPKGLLQVESGSRSEEEPAD